jgi:hypothetical protein
MKINEAKKCQKYPKKWFETITNGLYATNCEVVFTHKSVEEGLLTNISGDLDLHPAVHWFL